MEVDPQLPSIQDLSELPSRRFVTPHLARNWVKEGFQKTRETANTVLKTLYRVFVQNGEQHLLDDPWAEEPLWSVSQEVLRSTLQGDELTPAQACEFFNTLREDNCAIDEKDGVSENFCHAIDFPNHILDIMAELDIEIAQGGQIVKFGKGDPVDARRRLIELTKKLAEKQETRPTVDYSEFLSRLDLKLLAEAEIFPNETTISSKCVRINTQRIYKQRIFNLAREETEGYSRLLVELVSNMGPPLTNAIADDPSQYDLYLQRLTKKVEIVSIHLTELIGCFNLDPNRVLDTVLDVFAANVTHHHEFFLRLLEISPWFSKKYDNALPIPVDNRENWLPPCPAKASATCAALLGRRLCEPMEIAELDDSVLLVAALLLKHGFVDLTVLYPYLKGEEQMKDSIRTYREDLRDKRLGGPENALTRSVLSDADGPSIAPVEAPPTAEKAAGPSPPSPSPVESCIGDLLAALLRVGDLKNAHFFFIEFQGITGPRRDCAELLCKLMHTMIHPAYSAISPNMNFPKRLHSVRSNGDNHSVLTTRASHRDFEKRRFHLDWKKGLPQFASVDEILRHGIFYLRCIGSGRLDTDVVLVGKLCRIAKHSLADASKTVALLEKEIALEIAKVGNETTTSELEILREKIQKAKSRSEELREAWLSMTQEFFLPAVSLTEANPGFTREVYDLIKQYSYKTRFGLYGDWRRTYKIIPELGFVEKTAARGARTIMKVLSKADVKPTGRQLAKLAHSNPLIVLEIVVGLLESYDNMIPHVADSCKYLSEFAYDVMTYVLLDFFSGDKKRKLKEDGTNIAHWLQSLAAFNAHLYKRFGHDLTCVLEYVGRQLMANQTYDLIVLSELIAKMSGYELAELTEGQLAAQSGGTLLQTEAFNLAGSRTAPKPLKRSATRLADALQESRQTIPLLILIAQERERVVFDDAFTNLKLLGNLFDTCQEVLLQYVSFISGTLDSSTYSAIMPSLTDLVSKDGYYIAPEMAFHILRPKLAYDVEVYDKNLAKEQERLKLLKEQEPKKVEEKVEIKDEDVVMADAGDDVKVDGKEEGGAEKSTAKDEGKEVIGKDEDVVMESVETPATMLNANNVTPPVINTDIAASSSSVLATPGQASASLVARTPDDHDVWHPILLPVIKELSFAFADAPNMWKALSQHFYTTFWFLRLHDLEMPLDRYTAEQDALNREYATLKAESSREASSRLLWVRMDRVLTKGKALRAEAEEQVKHVAKVSRRLNLEKVGWFEGIEQRPQSAEFAYQYCWYPRFKFSASDAIFCARLLRKMHDMGTPRFSTLLFLNLTFATIGDSPASSTEHEALNIARFLKEIMSLIMRWHSDKRLFDSEAVGKGLPGMQRSWGNEKGGRPSVPLDYRSYRLVVFNWHIKLESAFLAHLKSGEFMRIRNALNILYKISDYFPRVKNHGHRLLDAVNNLQETEDRPDLKLLAKSYGSQLKLASPTWAEEEAFGKQETAVRQQVPGAQQQATDRSNSSSSVKQTSPVKSLTHTVVSRSSEVAASKPAQSSSTSVSTQPVQSGSSNLQAVAEIGEARASDRAEKSGRSSEVRRRPESSVASPVPVASARKTVVSGTDAGAGDVAVSESRRNVEESVRRKEEKDSPRRNLPAPAASPSRNLTTDAPGSTSERLTPRDVKETNGRDSVNRLPSSASVKDGRLRTPTDRKREAGEIVVSPRDSSRTERPSESRKPRESQHRERVDRGDDKTEKERGGGEREVKPERSRIDRDRVDRERARDSKSERETPRTTTSISSSGRDPTVHGSGGGGGGKESNTNGIPPPPVAPSPAKTTSPTQRLEVRTESAEPSTSKSPPPSTGSADAKNTIRDRLGAKQERSYTPVMTHPLPAKPSLHPNMRPPSTSVTAPRSEREKDRDHRDGRDRRGDEKEKEMRDGKDKEKEKERDVRREKDKERDRDRRHEKDRSRDRKDRKDRTYEKDRERDKEKSGSRRSRIYDDGEGSSSNSNKRKIREDRDESGTPSRDDRRRKEERETKRRRTPPPPPATSSPKEGGVEMSRKRSFEETQNGGVPEIKLAGTAENKKLRLNRGNPDLELARKKLFRMNDLH